MSKFSVGIIGGGIAGLSAGFFLQQKFGADCSFKIFEKENHLGGTIGVTHENGFTIDWGPNGFLDKEPLTLKLAEQLGLSNQLLPANDKAEKRFIFRNNKLWEINPNPLKFMTSGLLSLAGRLRIPVELIIPPKTDSSPETIYDFVSRRIGSEAADILIDPMVSGIFGGDAKKLELSSCFPIMRQMEIEYSGLIKAMIKKKKAAQNRSKAGGPAGPSGRLTSFTGGLHTIIAELEKKLSDNLCYPVDIRAINKSKHGKYEIVVSAQKYEFDHLILAVPAYAAAKLMGQQSTVLTDLLDGIPYSNIAVVCQGYKLSDVGHDLDGFGFLIPHNQNKNILGSIWTSIIFPEQAPAGYALFRTMLGGARNNQIIKKNETEIAEIASSELTPILDLKGTPAYQKVIIWDKAIPQYILGHAHRLSAINSELDKLGNISLAGNAYTGIGINDTIKRSYNIVESISIN